MKKHPILLTAVTAALLAARGAACDFCSCDLPAMDIKTGTGLSFRVSEQFTHFGTLQQDNRVIANPAGEFMDSSVTQLIIGYDFAHALGVQLNVPLVYRSFQRWHNGMIERGSVSGVGDVSFLLHWTPMHLVRSDLLVAARIYAGLSLPTGDSSRVLEEAAEGGGADGDGGEAAALPSGIHGHDLALGTGSVSGIFGFETRVQWKRVFVTAGIEGVARTNGAHFYRYADEIGFHGALGAFLVDGEDFDLSLAAQCTGTSKGQDVFMGQTATDTSGTVVYLGPQVAATWAKRYHAEVSVLFPVLNENSGVQAVPDLRVTAAFGFRF
jgi:hypothetical protein